MKILKILHSTLAISVFCFTVSAYASGTGIEFKEYSYKDEGDIIQYPVTDTFVITDAKRAPLSAFVPSQKILLSLKVEEPAPEQEIKPSKQQEKLQEKELNKVEKTSTQCSHTVYFEFDRYNLVPSERKRLDENFNCFKDKEVEVLGYASPPGPARYNLVLSAKRAQTVADYLKTKGITLSLIKGMGETSESNIEAMNRKVEIKCK
ncbi:OmpA family protein [Thermodesulfovibrio sp. 3907-1M]|jgi:outer membrane protein OmpA-like peptidoglycan-associated protein|uniref:OmpA family protein n=1 Tax=Thermodesulfovibrio autotrophicus TaxID=3118333 RepID=A0AAU8H014_9BACT